MWVSVLIFLYNGLITTTVFSLFSQLLVLVLTVMTPTCAIPQPPWPGVRLPHWLPASEASPASPGNIQIHSKLNIFAFDVYVYTKTHIAMIFSMFFPCLISKLWYCQIQFRLPPSHQYELIMWPTLKYVEFFCVIFYIYSPYRLSMYWKINSKIWFIDLHSVAGIL